MIKPMLLCRETPNTATIPYPVYVTSKLDGIRCIIKDGEALSRTLKPIPNKEIQLWAFKNAKLLNGLDGELIVGNPTDDDVYRNTNSFVMSHDKEGPFTFYAFDRWDSEEVYSNRLSFHVTAESVPNVLCVKQYICNSEQELLETEESVLEQGYEGLILRYSKGKYKFGRTTLKELNTLKLKRFEDSEAEVIGFEEEMHNGNTAEVNELGRTKRSTAMAGLTGKGTLGALVVKDNEVTFNVGSGFSHLERQYIWDNRDSVLGRMVKYRFFNIGIKDKPRHPIFLGFRDTMDM
jgi:DNA ligase 1